MSIEAMKQVRSVMRAWTGQAPHGFHDALTALETAIEAAEKQEPVAIALNTGTKQGVKWLKNVEHGEKLYTHPAPAAQREPDELTIAYMSGLYDGKKHAAPVQEFECPRCGHCCGQRQWVGLTEQERSNIEDACEMMIGTPAFEAIEAKLKAKNHG